MRTVTKVKLIIVGLAALGAAVSPRAHADADTTYIADLTNHGVALGTPAQEVYIGHLVCQNLASGLSPVQAAARMVNGGGVPIPMASMITALAMDDLCPQYIPPGSPSPTATGASAPGGPPGANCQTVPLGALYCDGPVLATGGWTRCVETPIYECYHRDPTAPPVKIGEPDHHIGDGL
jgi:hypothetical protein